MSKWVCQYCQHAQILQNANYGVGSQVIDIHGLNVGPVGLAFFAMGCANSDCSKLTLTVSLNKALVNVHGTISRVTNEELLSWPILPESNAKPQPNYIPAPIVEDYTEACRIKELSPKASATLSRRCLQGMIRDFCGISKAQLIEEIRELRRRVDEGEAPRGVNPEAVDAIDHVRAIGNIGAHMEKDINVIIAVDPDEAQRLIDLIELLFDEWYNARHQRDERLAKIANTGEKKQKEIADGRASRLTLAAPVVKSETETE